MSNQRTHPSNQRKLRENPKKQQEIIVPVPLKVSSLTIDEQCLTEKQTLSSKGACESVKQPEEPKVSPKKEVVPEKVDSPVKKTDSDSVNSTDRRTSKFRIYTSTPSQYVRIRRRCPRKRQNRCGKQQPSI